MHFNIDKILKIIYNNSKKKLDLLVLNVKLYFFFQCTKDFEKKPIAIISYIFIKGVKNFCRKKTFFHFRIYIYIGALIYTMNTDNQSNDKITAICVVEEFAVFKRHWKLSMYEGTPCITCNLIYWHNNVMIRLYPDRYINIHRRLCR